MIFKEIIIKINPGILYLTRAPITGVLMPVKVKRSKQKNNEQ